MKRTALFTVLLGLAAASPARADWLLTPYIGGVFGGASNQFTLNDADDEFEQRMNLGVSLGYYSKGIFGFEVDYSATPNFFQFTGGTNNFDLLDLDSSVQTLMGNVVIAVPVGGTDGPFRPYVSAGLGTIRTQLRSESDVFDELRSNDSGYNFGAGAHLRAAGRVGIRADEVFNFWRATVGVTFRFGN